MKLNKGYINIRLVLIIGISFIFASVSYSQFRMGNTLAPLKDNEYSIVYSNDVKGGHHQVATIAERDAIPMLRRQLGMLCTVLDDGIGNHKTYQLIGGLSNTNWTEFLNSIGSGNQQLAYDQVTHFLTLDNGGTVDLSGLISSDNQLLSYNQVTHSLTLENGGTIDLNLALSETDPKWTSESANYFTKSELQTSGLSQLNFDNITNTPSTLSAWNITDAISITHPISSISDNNITQWNESYNRGNHADLYLNNNLNKGSVFIGDDNNIARTVVIKGDATLDYSGVLTINNEAITSDKIIDLSIEGDMISIANQKKGDLIYFDGISWVRTQSGTNGQLLIIKDGIPAWNYLSTGIGSVNVTISDTTKTGVTANVTVLADGLAAITERGVVWGTNSEPTINENKIIGGFGLGTFSISLVGLSELTKYYLRAYVINSSGINYSNSVSFIPRDLDIPIDGDGNVYQTVQIGEQLWMAENLKTTKFHDGNSIALVTDNLEWISINSPAYCWYDNNEVLYKNPYGALYNYYSVMNGRLCPIGWHVPTEANLKSLELLLGMTPQDVENTYWHGTDQGDQLKEAGVSHWQSPNLGTNSTGFRALPGGYRNPNDGNFMEHTLSMYIWSSSTFVYWENYSWGRQLASDWSSIYHYYYDNKSGFSVRCIRDY
jgi:uncharacterized protein (TIGR02145 family)